MNQNNTGTSRTSSIHNGSMLSNNNDVDYTFGDMIMNDSIMDMTDSQFQDSLDSLLVFIDNTNPFPTSNTTANSVTNNNNNNNTARDGQIEQIRPNSNTYDATSNPTAPLTQLNMNSKNISNYSADQGTVYANPSSSNYYLANPTGGVIVSNSGPTNNESGWESSALAMSVAYQTYLNSFTTTTSNTQQKMGTTTAPPLQTPASTNTTMTAIFPQNQHHLLGNTGINQQQQQFIGQQTTAGPFTTAVTVPTMIDSNVTMLPFQLESSIPSTTSSNQSSLQLSVTNGNSKSQSKRGSGRKRTSSVSNTTSVRSKKPNVDTTRNRAPTTWSATNSTFIDTEHRFQETRNLEATISDDDGTTVDGHTYNGTSSDPSSNKKNNGKSRQVDRNLREQMRSQRVTEQIHYLRELVQQGSNIKLYKSDKFTTLVTVDQYIRDLREKSIQLDEEHKKILDTLTRTSEIVNGQYIPSSDQEEQYPIILFDPSSKTGLDTSYPDGCVSSSCQSSVMVQKDSTNNNNNNSLEDSSRTFVNDINYKFIFDCCPFACSITSIDGRFLDVNEEFIRLTKYTRSELIPPPESTSLPISSSQQQPATSPTTNVSSTTLSSTHLVGKSNSSSSIQDDQDLDVQDQQDQKQYSPHEHNQVEEIALSSSSSSSHMDDSVLASRPESPSRKGSIGSNAATTTASNTTTNLTKRSMNTTSSSKSLFNVLHRDNIENLFCAMSSMLKFRDDVVDDTYNEFDTWTADTVRLNRTDPDVHVTLRLNLVRSSNGLPRFFNCVLIENTTTTPK